MTFFFSLEIKQQLRTVGGWVTAFSLFAACCFVIGWPLREDLAVTQTVGPSVVWALMILSSFLVLSNFWRPDIQTGLAQSIAAQQNARFGAYARGRTLAAMGAMLVYASAALAVGGLLFAVKGPAFAVLCVQTLVTAPAVAALSVTTAALTATTRVNGAGLGIVLLVPLLAPLLIFGGIFQVDAALSARVLVPSLAALVGLGGIYVMLCLITLPLILRSQL